MSDEPKRAEAQENGAVADARDAAGGNDQVAGLEAQVAELRDKYLRAVAEIENVRKRAEREVAGERAFGITAFARDLLGVADNLARTLDAVGAEARASAGGPLKTLLDGVELTGRELQKALEKNGVRRIDPRGEKFNPHFHQAVFEVPDADVPAGMVAEVIQPGYAIGERVLRPAMVGVSSGRPKAAPAQEDARSDS
ncbi:MAG TPA: nucleotide exchange factor GrpE [Xanthobacteraceae bacterium]|nr:nucleotide exchange factor GrpE [Xanthobacteraceae bacterium]